MRADVVDRVHRQLRVVEQTGRGPTRIDGYTIGAPDLTSDPPHNGEMHPDGDELLYMVSGSVTVRLELPEGDRVVELDPGDAVVEPSRPGECIIHSINLFCAADFCDENAA